MIGFYEPDLVRVKNQGEGLSSDISSCFNKE